LAQQQIEHVRDSKQCLHSALHQGTALQDLLLVLFGKQKKAHNCLQLLALQPERAAFALPIKHTRTKPIAAYKRCARWQQWNIFLLYTVLRPNNSCKHMTFLNRSTPLPYIEAQSWRTQDNGKPVNKLAKVIKQQKEAHSVCHTEPR
jgi:hypothetical protein